MNWAPCSLSFGVLLIRFLADETGVGGLSDAPACKASPGKEVDVPEDGKIEPLVAGSLVVLFSVSSSVAFGLKLHSPSKGAASLPLV
jgi:hypothetical protein